MLATLCVSLSSCNFVRFKTNKKHGQAASVYYITIYG